MVDVPDPAHVLAVGKPVVEEERHLQAARERWGHGAQEEEHLVGACRVLGQQEAQAAALDRNDLLAAERRPDIAERAQHGIAGDAEDAAGRDGSKGVLDVVDAGERHLDPAETLHREAGRIERDADLRC